MPQLYFLDNYCYELSSIYFSVYKYDIFEHNYYKIDQYLIDKAPAKYQEAINNIKHFQEADTTKDIRNMIKDIKISAY